MDPYLEDKQEKLALQDAPTMPSRSQAVPRERGWKIIDNCLTDCQLIAHRAGKIGRRSLGKKRYKKKTQEAVMIEGTTDKDNVADEIAIPPAASERTLRPTDENSHHDHRWCRR